MINTYTSLVKQTFHFPQEGFEVSDEGYLEFNDVDLKALIDKYGTPLKLTYLPKIGRQINKAKKMFDTAFKKHRYEGQYFYCYCTKSSHFSFAVEEALKHEPDDRCAARGAPAASLRSVTRIDDLGKSAVEERIGGLIGIRCCGIVWGRSRIAQLQNPIANAGNAGARVGAHALLGDDEARGALLQRADRRAAAAEDQVSFPMSRCGSACKFDPLSRGIGVQI